MIGSLEKNPENGGTPINARYPSPKVTKVIGMSVRRPPNRRMSVSSFIACITEPAPRNNPALKNPWVSRCMIANA